MWQRLCMLVVVVGLLTTGVGAAPVYLIWREPTASGTLSFTTVYWCPGVGCTDWSMRAPTHCVSTQGTGGRTKKVVLSIPVIEGSLPRTVRFKVTATDIFQNETAGVTIDHTFVAE